MRLVVKKFGGTSVGDVPRIRNVAILIQDYLNANRDTKVVLVVSAMSGETDKLLALAKSCVSAPPLRELDQLASTGEQVSAALLAMALCELGLNAKSILGFQAGVLTDDTYGESQIKAIDPARLTAMLEEGIIPVVTGFQGISDSGDITTLGRGGSDISAVAIASALKADQCFIYTDVEGVYSADPRICKSARLLSEISHEEMLELSSQGAKVLHPRSIEFAHRYQVPLVTLSTFVKGKGTRIVREGDLMEKPIVSGITYRTDEAKLTITKLPGGIGSLSCVFEELSNAGILVDMITQTGLVSDRTAVCFTVPDNSSTRALELTRGIVPKLGAEGAELDRDIAKISVVGTGMRTHSGVAAQMFRVLADQGIEVSMISTSEIKISVLVSRKYGEMAVRALHESFIEDAPKISVEL